MKIRIQQLWIEEECLDDVNDYYINIKDLFQYMDDLKKSYAHTQNQSTMLINELERIRKEYLTK